MVAKALSEQAPLSDQLARAVEDMHGRAHEIASTTASS
jgi:hypothetical protein